MIRNPEPENDSKRSYKIKFQKLNCIGNDPQPPIGNDLVRLQFQIGKKMSYSALQHPGMFVSTQSLAGLRYSCHFEKNMGNTIKRGTSWSHTKSLPAMTAEWSAD
jgi:hypothetical protein